MEPPSGHRVRFASAPSCGARILSKQVLSDFCAPRTPNLRFSSEQSALEIRGAAFRTRTGDLLFTKQLL